MTVRRLVSILSVCTIASASVVVAQPKKAPAPAKPDAKKAPPPAPTPTPTPAPGSGSASGSAATPAPPPDEPPPKDIEGRDENPGNPGGTTVDPNANKIVAPVKKKNPGYPIEEYARPINLPQNMSEVSIGPHAQLGFGDDVAYAGGDALHARFGATRSVQLGLTYLFAGIFDDPGDQSDKLGFHGGKAVGLDVTVLLANWIGVRVGVPVYLKPVAFSLTLGAPIKFQLGDKFAIGGLDDLLNIKLKRFAPTFYQEAQNATNAALDETNTTLSNGELRISAFGVYQRDRKTAFVGKLGFQLEDFTANSGQSMNGGGISYFIRAGVQYSPRKYLDLGVSLGFDDLAHPGSLGPAGLLALRI